MHKRLEDGSVDQLVASAAEEREKRASKVSSALKRANKRYGKTLKKLAKSSQPKP